MMSDAPEQDDVTDESPFMIDVLGDLGGLPIPAPIKKNFFKAIGQLISSACDVPVAGLEAIAQGIRTEANAKSIVKLGAARAAANQFQDDPKLADRALLAYGGRIIGEQANREAVARAALEELRKIEPPEDEPKSLDDDWLYKFSRYSEGVSSEQMQKVWGRVLAQQVSDSGKYSVKALNTLSVLDGDDAELFQRVVNHMYMSDSGEYGILMPWRYSGGDIESQLREWWIQSKLSDAVEHLDALGLAHYDNWGSHLVFKEGENEIEVSVSGVPFLFKRILDAHPDQKYDLGPRYQLTKLGKELSQLIELETQDEYLQMFLTGLGNKAIEIVPLDVRGEKIIKSVNSP